MGRAAGCELPREPRLLRLLVRRRGQGRAARGGAPRGRARRGRAGRREQLPVGREPPGRAPSPLPRARPHQTTCPRRASAPDLTACVRKQLAEGAEHVTTLDYLPVRSEHPRVTALVPAEARDRYLQGRFGPFDGVVSYSSVEHSGLGRCALHALSTPAPALPARTVTLVRCRRGRNQPLGRRADHCAGLVRGC